MRLTFTLRTSSYDEATGLTSETVATIAGEAILKSDAEPVMYAEAKLVPSLAPMLLFTPDDYPKRAYTTEFLMPGDETTLNGVPMTVKAVRPIAPDGFVVAAYVIVGA